MMFQTEQRVKTIKDLYDYAVENSEELLGNWQSSATDDFWLPYVLENDLYDRFFCSRYKNWYYFDQTGDETVAEVFQNFVNAVTDFLMVNDKRFSEMFKVEQLTISYLIRFRYFHVPLSFVAITLNIEIPYKKAYLKFLPRHQRAYTPTRGRVRLRRKRPQSC